jgi:FMN-dependent oxidoreductase (nitrilotriacetate monooxygenase family)
VTMRLALFINPTGHHQAAWRHPDVPAAMGVSFSVYKELAQAAESAVLDAIFIADNQCVRPGPPEAVSRVAQYVANFEPLTLISALAAVTERIGLIATASTTYNHPFQVARKFASIDHLSGGRVAWNMVTSGFANEAQNFGHDVHPDHDVRYAVAAEFVETCLGLWDSWEDDALPRDKASGVFSEPSGLHVLGHEGEHCRVRGPLNVPRMPQGYPVLVQAGNSEAGKAFGTKYADMMFTTPLTVERGREMYAELKARAADHGRDPDGLAVMPGLVVVLGRTSQEARERFEELQSYVDVAVALNALSLKLGGVDLSGCPLDAPMPASAAPADDANAFERWREIGEREGLTLRELAVRASGSMAGCQVTGTATEVADMMEDWFRTGAADGFNIMPATLPQGFTEFAEQVIPELQRRGLVRTRYEGRTLRDHFGLARPAWGERSPYAAAL